MATTTTGGSDPRAGRHIAGRVAGLCIAALIAGAVPAARAAPAPARQENARTIRLMRVADIPFEKYSVRPTTPQIAFMKRRFERMMVYTPYFDTRLSWYGRAWFYQNAYALYPDGRVTAQHPSWILRDQGGKRTYIPWGCARGTCPAYAANILDPAYRAWWIAKARVTMAAGYQGVFVDDASLTRRVSDGDGKMVAPVDPVTGRPITAQQWAQAMVAFLKQIRSAFPAREVVDNSVWFYDTDHHHKSPLLHRQIQSADYSMMEFGVTDHGITGGEGPYSLARLMAYIDVVHHLGRAIIMGGTPDEGRGRAYAVGCYLLATNGQDLIEDNHVTPDNPQPIYQVRIGTPLGPRRRWNGLWRRDFTGGTVVVNEPGAPAMPLAGLDGRQWDGAALPDVLPAKAAVIVLRR